MSNDTQAVADNANPESQTSGEESGAQDELDSLLQEYEQETSTTGEQQTQPDTSSQRDSQVEVLLMKQTQDDINSAANSIKEASGVELPDRFFRGYLHDAVDGDPRALRLWQNRHNDPKGWNKYLNVLAKEASEELKGVPDRSASEDRDAVESAVRNASKHQQSSDDEPDWSQMSDQEFAQTKMKLARDAKKV